MGKNLEIRVSFMNIVKTFNDLHIFLLVEIILKIEIFPKKFSKKYINFLKNFCLNIAENLIFKLNLKAI
jgi:hypothetical protein